MTARRAVPSGPRVTRPPPALVQGIGLRVCVLGTRGKATLAGLVTAALRRRGLAVHCNVPRTAAPQRRSFMARQAAALGLPAGDDEAVDEVAAGVHAAWPTQALVLANPARTLAGMRRVHTDVAMPHYVLVTNVRRDPQGVVSRPPAKAAQHMVRSITPGAIVVCGDDDPAMRAVLRVACHRAGLAFLDAARPREADPAAGLLALLEAFLLHRFQGFLPGEADAVRRELDARFRWEPSSLPGVHWFDAGAIHDVDSAQIVLNHLQARDRRPVTFIAYLRRDQPARTKAFGQFLAGLLAAPDARQVLLCGHRATSVAQRLSRWRSQVRIVPDDPASLPKLVRRLQFDCQGGAILMLANDRGAWPEALARHLQTPAASARGQVPHPLHAPMAAKPVAPVQVPAPIVRPLVAPAPLPSAQPPPPSLPPPRSPPVPTPAPAPTGLAAAAAALPSPLSSIPSMAKPEAVH